MYKTLAVVIVFLVMRSESQAPPELFKFFSNSACYGSSYENETFLNFSCQNSLIVISDLKVGVNPKTDNCSDEFTTSDSAMFDTCCRNVNNTDCIYSYINPSSNLYSLKECIGEPTCKKQALRTSVHSSCDSTLYGTGTSHYMFAEYYCINPLTLREHTTYRCMDDNTRDNTSNLEHQKCTNIADICSSETLTANDTTLYLWEGNIKRSPTNPSASACPCSIEIDNCSASIIMYTMYRFLQPTQNYSGACVNITDSENSVQYDWMCGDDSFVISSETIMKTYISVTFWSQYINQSDGGIWLGFGASQPSNIRVNCPAVSQQNCNSTTTTMVTSTTTIQTTTATNLTNTTASTTVNVTAVTLSTTGITANTTSTAVTTTDNVSTTTDSARTTTGETTGPSYDGLRTAVIVLGVMVALLLVAVVILSYCLWKKSRKPSVDVEKSSLTKVLLSSSKSSLSAQEKNAEKQVVARGTFTVPKVDCGCQADFNPPKPWSANVDCQTVERSPVARTSDVGCQAVVNTTDTTEKGCQVEGLVQKANANCQADSAIETRNKQTNTKPAATTWDIGIQTRKQPAEDRAIQTNHPQTKAPVITSPCQTYITAKEIDKLSKKEKELLPDSDSADSSDFSGGHFRQKKSSPRPQRRMWRKLPRKSANKIEHRSTESYSGKSPVQLDAVIPEFMREKSAAESSALSDTVPNKSVNHTKYVFPPGAMNSEDEQKVRRKSDIRSAIYKSFFATEKAEERFETYLAKHPPQLKKRKKKKQSLS